MLFKLWNVGVQFVLIILGTRSVLDIVRIFTLFKKNSKISMITSHIGKSNIQFFIIIIIKTLKLFLFLSCNIHHIKR